MSQKTMWVFEGTRSEKYSDEYLSDPALIQALGPFDLDPATPLKMPWATAENRYTIEDDGLQQEWKGKVWLNPPYSNIEPFMHKLAEHGNGIALIYARTETKWFFETVWKRATGIFFFEGRTYFYRPSGERLKSNAGSPTCLAIYGPNNFSVVQHSSLRGKLLRIS